MAPSLTVPEFSPALSACVDELVSAAQDLQAEVANLVRLDHLLFLKTLYCKCKRKYFNIFNSTFVKEVDRFGFL